MGESTETSPKASPPRREEKEEEEVEPILRDQGPARWVLFPIDEQYKDIYDLHKATEAQNWMASEIDLSVDRQQYKGVLTAFERRLIDWTVSFFAASDGLVMENLNVNFSAEVRVPEILAFFAYQTHNEAVHSETYSLMIDALSPSRDKKMHLLQAFKENPCVERLIQWGNSWLDKSKHPFRVRNTAFVIYEALLFSGKFAVIFWFKKRNLLPGVCHANQLIARDESVHEDAGVMIHGKLKHKVEPDVVRAMVDEALQIDLQYFGDLLSEPAPGMNYELMADYLRIVSNRILGRFGCDPVYPHRPNSISDMMDTIGAENKTSFFEHRNPVYQSGYSKAATAGSRNFDIGADF